MATTIGNIMIAKETCSVWVGCDKIAPANIRFLNLVCGKMCIVYEGNFRM